MFTAAFLAVVIGFAIAQESNSDIWDMPMPVNMPKVLDWSGMTYPPNNIPAISQECDLQSLQSCLATFMESPGMQWPMGIKDYSKVYVPYLDKSCQVITQLVKCIQPTAKSCGPQIASVVSSTADAINYICVDARSETQKYMQCMARDNNAAKMSQCVFNMVQEETAMLKDMRDPGAMIGRLCGLMERYELCVENKADSLCNEGNYMKHIFGLFNRGLSFLQCKGLGQDGQNKAVPVPKLHVQQLEVSGISDIQRTMRCMQMTITPCMSPNMALFFSNQTASKLSGDSVCREFGTLEDCLSRSVKCGPQTRHMIATMKEIYIYVCFEKRGEFQESFSCLARDITPIFNRCWSMNYLEIERDFAFERAQQDVICGAIGFFGSCVSREIEIRCGHTAGNLLHGLQPEIDTLMMAQAGIECSQDAGEVLIGPYHQRRHGLLKIVRLTVGVVVVLVILLIITATRCRHSATRRQESQNADLAKNDLLQQNLIFATTKTQMKRLK